MPPTKERIYSESEIAQVLAGLTVVYLKQPWYSRWLWKPWKDALESAYTCFCGASNMAKLEAKELGSEIEDFLNSK